MPETHPGIYRTDISSKVSRKLLTEVHVSCAFCHFINSLFPIGIKMSSFYMMQLHGDSNTATLFWTPAVLVQYLTWENNSYFIDFSCVLLRNLIQVVLISVTSNQAYSRVVLSTLVAINHTWLIWNMGSPNWCATSIKYTLDFKDLIWKNKISHC